MEPTVQKKDKELMEKIQHRFTKIIKNTEGKSYDNRLRHLGLWTLKERRNRQDLIKLFKIFKELSRELFMLDENMKGTRGHYETMENSVHQRYQ